MFYNLSFVRQLFLPAPDKTNPKLSTFSRQNCPHLSTLPQIECLLDANVTMRRQIGWTSFTRRHPPLHLLRVPSRDSARSLGLTCSNVDVPGLDLAEGVLRDALVRLRVDLLAVVGGAERRQDQVAVGKNLE